MGRKMGREWRREKGVREMEEREAVMLVEEEEREEMGLRIKG